MARFLEKIKALKEWKLVDFPFLFVLLILLALGLVALSSASSYYSLTETGDSMYYLKRQLMFAGIGLVGMFVAFFTEKRTYKRWSYMALIISLIASA